MVVPSAGGSYYRGEGTKTKTTKTTTITITKNIDKPRIRRGNGCERSRERGTKTIITNTTIITITITKKSDKLLRIRRGGGCTRGRQQQRGEEQVSSAGFSPPKLSDHQVAQM